MTVRLTNAQREVAVNMRRMSRFTRCAIQRLRVRSLGRLAITFIDSRSLRALNKRFLHHDRPTDVLSFRYDREPVVGDILIAPRQAHSYARRHRILYEQELARYVAHGLLHWLGYQDDTFKQQHRMRRKENQILRQCGSWLGARGSGC